MASITLESVEKRYGKVNAVRGISMDVRDGEFVAFLGPSGCGKSSTMRMIAGLEEISGGDILFDGLSIVNRKPGQRNVAMAFETYALYPTLNVYENLAFPLRAARWKQPEIDRRVKEIAQIIGISDLLDRKPGKLSSGQSQAVGLARALIRKPNVFLLDEPISHLDTSQRFQMRMYIKRLHIELGYTMIIVTHDQEDAMALADRVAVMNNGLLQQIDTPQNIYNHPADLFVAGFIGNLPMNFFEGRVISESGKTYIQRDSTKLEVSTASARLTATLPEEAILGIRPPDLRLYPIQDVSPPDSFLAEIFVVEPQGDINVATIEFKKNRFQVVAPATYRAAPHTKVNVSFDPRHILIFDKRTGKVLG